MLQSSASQQLLKCFQPTAPIKNLLSFKQLMSNDGYPLCYQLYKWW